MTITLEGFAIRHFDKARGMRLTVRRIPLPLNGRILVNAPISLTWLTRR